MSSFTSPLCVICPNYRKNDKYFILNESFLYYTNDKQNIIVPKGFKTDFASIPRIFWSFLPPYGKYSKYADKIFLEAMQVLGVDTFTRHVLYWGVRSYAYLFRIK